MKLALSVVFTLALQCPAVSAAEQIVTLGDSLTYAYESEFGTQVSIPFVVSYGDGFGSKVCNWVEILNKTTYRNASFDIGSRDTLHIIGGADFFFRNRYNWALPGMKINDLSKFLNHEVTLNAMLGPDLANLLALTNFNEADDFAIGELESQIQTTAERLTLFIGGNDIRGVYGDIYNNNAPGTFVADFVRDATAIIDRVRFLRPNLQIVLVNVPHVGITPEVKSKWPTDPIKTGRVTTVLLDLNRQLAALATSRNIGYADVFNPTLSLLTAAPLCIHGITIANSGSTTGNLAFVWLNGPVSKNFHPNTSAQAIIANAVIAAFNTRYHTGIAPLSATEILGGLLAKTPAQIDMTFASWMTGFGLTGLPPGDDSDGDGLTAGVEFALGLNPILRDSDMVSTHITGNALELAYPIRLPVSTRYTLTPTHSANLTSFIAVSPLPAPGPDGLAHALLPISNTPGFMRLEATVP
ncbi:MAG: SGNH/GDSL hydrolase family protein [Luteolibacter sp.]